MGEVIEDNALTHSVASSCPCPFIGILGTKLLNFKILIVDYIRQKWQVLITCPVVQH